MKTFKIYEYGKCDSCRKALRFLEQRKIPHEKIPIVERPPSKEELRRMLGHLKGEYRRLFNTSGQVYREMGLSRKLETMSVDEAIDALSRNGKLIKRPFMLGDGLGLVGFDESEWKKAFIRP